MGVLIGMQWSVFCGSLLGRQEKRGKDGGEGEVTMGESEKS